MSLSARRAWIEITYVTRLPRAQVVALRKESVDRNTNEDVSYSITIVALRKESVDRNRHSPQFRRRPCVALRKESVDRNLTTLPLQLLLAVSLSARRAWIEIPAAPDAPAAPAGRSPQGERG